MNRKLVIKALRDAAHALSAGVKTLYHLTDNAQFRARDDARTELVAELLKQRTDASHRP